MLNKKNPFIMFLPFVMDIGVALFLYTNGVKDLIYVIILCTCLCVLRTCYLLADYMDMLETFLYIMVNALSGNDYEDEMKK